MSRRSDNVPEGRFIGERTQPVHPEDASSAMPHVPDESIPEPIAADGRQVAAVSTHKEPKHRAARRTGIVIAVVVVLAAIVAAAAFISYQMGMWGDVDLPDVVGMSEAEAEATLADAGFATVSKHEKSDDGYGAVISMDPEGGQPIRHGSTVNLVVGEERIVPDVVGMKPDAARQALEQEGAAGEIAVEYRVSVDAAEDTVIGIEPEAGTVFKSSDAFILYVARALKVPNVKGMQQDEAVAAIEELGLTAQVEWRESSELYPTVLETDPLQGTRVEEGSTVTVYVANGGPEDKWHLTGYFQAPSSTDAAYLRWQQWELQYSDSSDGWITLEMWKNGNQDLFFGSEPWSFAAPDWIDPYSAESALDYDASFNGVRMNFSDLSEGTADEKTVQRYMAMCGFDNPQDTCTDRDISLPNKRAFDSGGVTRVCTYGVTDGYTWVILLKSTNDGAVDVSLVAMDDAAVARLTADGGSVCDMFMYRDAYPYNEDDDSA